MPADELIEYEPDAEGTQKTLVDDEIDDALEIPSVEEVDQEIEAERAAEARPADSEKDAELERIRSERDLERQRLSTITQEIQRRAAEQQNQQTEALYEEDPAQALKQEVDQMKAERHQERMYQEWDRAVKAVESQENEFRKTNPDYDDALAFAVERRRAIIKSSNPQMSDKAIDHAVAQTNHAVALRALHQGKNPAEVAMELSRQLGYGGQPAQQAAGYPQAPARPASPPPRRPIQTSLSAVAGKNAGGRKVTMEQAVNETTDQEFDALFQDPRHARNLSEHGYTVL